jgi:hypothetical protein
MRVHRFAVLAVTLAAVSACSVFQRKRAVEIKDTSIPPGSRWNATLATPSSLAGALQVRGSAWMAPEGDNTRAHVDISNAAPGGVHPWHVHIGQCGDNGQIFGQADAYRPLRVGSDGTASSDAEIPNPMPSSGRYYVNVHASPDNMGTIIACGNLAPPIK